MSTKKKEDPNDKLDKLLKIYIEKLSTFPADSAPELED